MSTIRTSIGEKMEPERFQTFGDFYPYYLSEHQNRICRLLHVIGSAMVLLEVYVLCTGRLSSWGWLLLPLTGYGFAWIGHFFFEHNRPATFTYPLWSLMGDWVMFFEVVTGRRGLTEL